MSRLIQNVILLFLSTVLLTPLTSYGEERTLTIVYTGRMAGELEPCGCTADSDMGGIQRLATVIDGFRRQFPDLVLIGSGGLLGTLLPAHRTSNAFLLKGLRYLDYDAIGVHWEDLIYGSDDILKNALPWVVSNWRTEDFAKARQFNRGDQGVVYLQWLALEASPYQQLPPGQKKTNADMMDLQQQLLRLRKNSFLTIVGTFEMDAPLEDLPLHLIDILILPATHEQYAQPERIGDTWILRPGSRGQYVAKLSLKQDDSERWQKRTHHIVPLDDSVPDSPRLEKWYEEYTAALALDFKKRKQIAKESQSQGLFAGVESCATCHEEQLAQWHATEHARALSSLRRVNKDHDANCLVCHTVGFGQPGGFPSLQRDINVENVGCETCHGPARAHVTQHGAVPLATVNEQICISCHTSAQSPHFNYPSYRARIAH